MSPYPPRFTVRVHGEDATANAVATVTFLGADEELTTEAVLAVPGRAAGCGGVAGGRGHGVALICQSATGSMYTYIYIYILT